MSSERGLGSCFLAGEGRPPAVAADPRPVVWGRQRFGVLPPPRLFFPSEASRRPSPRTQRHGERGSNTQTQTRDTRVLGTADANTF